MRTGRPIVDTISTTASGDGSGRAQAILEVHAKYHLQARTKQSRSCRSGTSDWPRRKSLEARWRNRVAGGRAVGGVELQVACRNGASVAHRHRHTGKRKSNMGCGRFGMLQERRPYFFVRIRGDGGLAPRGGVEKSGCGNWSRARSRAARFEGTPKLRNNTDGLLLFRTCSASWTGRTVCASSAGSGGGPCLAYHFPVCEESLTRAGSGASYNCEM